ncbi:uncharacterized protein FTOL_13884 [Fusarium torulosum]|uniref:Uncharacterized protein n=1 Tax=Fusarium torulosum TaxID=33205 RepID=A0AAE8MMZ1_9HYPO|nr:uncharacterized protein FTOL_13884 [Fusarium torulosum]
MEATSCTFKPKDAAESHIQLIIQELRDMDRGVRSAIKHQQKVIEASLAEWRRSELLINANNKKPAETTRANK